MANRWLLLEAFGGDGRTEPSVIGVGSTPKKMVSVTSVLSRGRHLEVVRELVTQVVLTGQPVRTITRDGSRQVVGDPLIAFSGRVHGVYAWLGHVQEQPPRRDPAGAWYFNLTTGKIGGSDDLLDLYGVAPKDRRSERVIAEAFTRLTGNADETAALALIVNAPPGFEHQATWTVRRDDGELRAANFACRAVLEVRAGGAQEVVLRGITHDIGPAESTPSAPPKLLLAQQVLAAERQPGRHRAIVNLRNLTLLRWIDDPLPGIAWENDAQFPPAIHPEDLSQAMFMSFALASSGRVTDSLRVRGSGGGWVRLQVEAALMLLDQHTTAAFVTVSRASDGRI